MIEQGVDGYGPEQYDGFHWEHFIGAILALVLAGLLVYLSVGTDRGSMWMLAAAGALVVLIVVAGGVSSFWRRYRFLVWWKKSVVLLSALLAIGGRWLVVGVLTGIFHPMGTPGISRGLGGPISREDIGLDKDGNLYRWNAWRERWEGRSASVGPGLEARYPLGSLFTIERGRLVPEGAEKAPDPYKRRHT
jgi:hypothetical protein